LEEWCDSLDIDYYGPKEQDDLRFAVMMMANQSGRNLFDMYSSNKIRNKPDKKLLLNMLKYENELRLSDEFMNDLENEALNTYEIPKYNQIWVSNVIENMQIKVVKQFGFKSDKEIEYGLHILRCAGYYYKNDNDIMNAVYYLKYNRAKPMTFNIGDKYKNINLVTLNNKNISFSNLLNNERPNIILAGSVS